MNLAEQIEGLVVPGQLGNGRGLEAAAGSLPDDGGQPLVGAKVGEPADSLLGGRLLGGVESGHVMLHLRREPLGRRGGGGGNGDDERDEGALDAMVGGALDAKLGARQELGDGEERKGGEEDKVDVVEDAPAPLEGAARADEAEDQGVSGEGGGGQVSAVAGVRLDEEGEDRGPGKLGDNLVGPLDGGGRVGRGDGALVATEQQGEGEGKEREGKDEGLDAAGAGKVAGFLDPLEEGPWGVCLEITMAEKAEGELLARWG